MNTFLLALLTTSLAMSAVMLLLMLLNKALANKVTAAFRYYLWLVVLLGLLIPFRPSISVPFEPVRLPIALAVETADTAQTTATTETAHAPIEPQQPHTQQLPAQEKPAAQQIPPEPPVDPASSGNPHAPIHLALGVWLSGMALVLARHMLAYGKFTASVRRWGAATNDAGILAVYQSVWQDLGLTGRQPAVKTCAFVSSPMLVGFRRPEILLPERPIPADELAHIFRHELIHLKHGDLWINLLVLLVSAMHWFNPLVYIMAKAVRTDCEAACDEAVVAGNDAQQRRHYGETIISFTGTGNAGTPVLSTYFFGGSSSM